MALAITSRRISGISAGSEKGAACNWARTWSFYREFSLEKQCKWEISEQRPPYCTIKHSTGIHIDKENVASSTDFFIAIICILTNFLFGSRVVKTSQRHRLWQQQQRQATSTAKMMNEWDSKRRNCVSVLQDSAKFVQCKAHTFAVAVLPNSMLHAYAIHIWIGYSSQFSSR